MSQYALERIFEPFFTTKNSGTGLGLSVAYGTIMQYKGYITVSSSEDQGTTFYIYLPTTSPSQVKEPQIQKISNFNLSKLNVLIVEDEFDIKILLKKLLQRYNIKPILALNANDAIEILRNTRIDLLITDIIMPDIDGRMLADMASTQNIDLRILLISGYSDTIVELKTNQEYLQKPFNASDLIAKIRTLFP